MRCSADHSSASSPLKQESLANAKVSARQQCVNAGKAPSEEIYGKSTQGTHYVAKYIQWRTTLSLSGRVCLHSFSSCYLPNLRIPRNSPKIRTVSSRSSEVIDLGDNRQRICNFLLVINSNSLAYRARQKSNP